MGRKLHIFMTYQTYRINENVQGELDFIKRFRESSRE